MEQENKPISPDLFPDKPGERTTGTAYPTVRNKDEEY
jgi:hypothetical protein